MESNVTTGVENAVKPLGKVQTRKRKRTPAELVRDILEELLNVPNLHSSKRIPRRSMPQVSDHDAFMADLRKSKINVTRSEVDPILLTPSQKHFSQPKVKQMIDTGRWKVRPILVSADFYVLDGHHRWLAAVQLQKKIKIIRINLSFDDLIAFVEDKPYIAFKKLHEELNVTA